MQIKKLFLDNFLSYNSAYVEFGKGLNVIAGNNAVGKTNLVESVYYSALGKSARNLKDKELINWANPTKGARIKLSVIKKYITHTVDIFIDEQGKKRITVDSIPLTKIGELIGVVNVVFFSPNEMKLIKESPVDRRRFIDISLSQCDKVYFYTLVNYNKLLIQRNKVLKTQFEKKDFKEMLTIITDKMIECEEIIAIKRRDFCEKITPYAAEEHRFLTDGKEELKLSYETEAFDWADIKGSLKKLYADSYDKDVKLSYTTVGVHRDDLKISVDEVDVRKYGSQGQQRTSALSLKLAEVALFRNLNGENPILILDDVLSELDINRQKALFKRIEGAQTLVTCTSFDNNLSDGYALHKVMDGQIYTTVEVK